MAADIGNGWRDFARSPFARALVALVCILILGAVFNADGAFFKWNTHRDMLRHISVFAVLACGMTVVILAGGIDLSVGSVLGLNAVLFALASIHWGLPPWACVALCLAAGTVCGMTSGALVARFRIQPFIATLAMMVFARGMAKWISGGQKISTAVKQADGSYTYVDVPHIFDVLSSKILSDNVAVVTVVFLVCLAVTGVVLGRLRWGRYIYAVGGNEEAARLSGVPVSATKLLVYGLCGLFAAVAGICQAAQEQQGDPEAGVSYELTAIAIVVMGGTSLMGGRGGIGLTLLGALTIGYLEKILSINAVGEATRLMLTGLIIVLAVIFQKREKIVTTKHTKDTKGRERMKTACTAVIAFALTAAIAGAQEKVFTIGMSQCNLGEPWRVQMNADIKKAADTHPNLKVVYKDAQNDTLKQVSQIEEFVSAGVDLLIVSPKEAAPLTPPVAAAFKKGIPVIVLDRRLLGDQYTSFIGADNKKIGKAAGKWIVEKLGGQGKVVELKGLMTSTPGQDRNSGFREGIKGSGLEVIFEADMKWLEPDARKEMESALARFEKINLVYAHNDPGAHGAYLAAKAAGREKEMIFVGIDGLPHEGQVYVRQGVEAASFEYPNGGKEAIDMALEILGGKTVAKEVTLSSRVYTPENLDKGGEVLSDE